MEVNCPHCKACFDGWIVSRSGPCPRCGKPLSPPPTAEAPPDEEVRDEADRPAGNDPPQDDTLTVALGESGSHDEEDARDESGTDEPETAPSAEIGEPVKPAPPATASRKEPAPPPVPQLITTPRPRPTRVYAAIAVIACASTVWYATRPGHIELTVSPIHAQVSIDGGAVDTPDGTLTGRMANGEHLLRVSCDGWAPLNETVSIRRGRTTVRQINLRPLSGLLQVTADQTGAELTLMHADGNGIATGRLNGETHPIEGVPLPAMVDIPMGDYRAVVTKVGFSAAPVAVVVPGGRELVQLSIPLADERGLVTVATRQKGLQSRFIGPKPADTQAAVITLTPDALARVSLSAGEYDVHFSDVETPANHWPSQRTVTVLPRGATRLSAELEERVLWTFRTRGTIKAGISLADLNDDGTPDAIFGSTDKHLYAVDGRDAKPLWSINVGSAIEQHAELSNLNGDAVLDCLITSAAGAVCAISGVDGQLLWQVRIGTPHGLSSPSVADLDLDGFADYVVTSACETGLVVRALSGASGDELWRYATTQHVFKVVEFTDRTGDRVADLVVDTGLADWMIMDGTDGQPVGTVDKTAAEPATKPGAGYPSATANAAIPDGLDVVSPAAQADLNGDGITDFIVASGDTVYAFAGRPPRVLMGLFCGDACALVGTAYVDEDAIPDIVAVGADGTTRAFSGANGRQLDRAIGATALPIDKSAERDGTSPAEPFCISEDGLAVSRRGSSEELAWTFKPTGKVRNPPTAADLTGNGTKDCLVATVSGWLHGIDGRSGDMLWASYLGGRNPSRVAAGDIDGDGADDAIVALPDDGVFAFSGRRGELLWSSRASRGTSAAPALADLNGDGRLDVIVAFSNGTIHVLDGEAWRGWTGSKPLWSIGGVKDSGSDEPKIPPATCKPYAIGWQNMVVAP